jgi:hypothetical protein
MAKNGRLYATDVTLSNQNQVWIRLGFAEPASTVVIQITAVGGYVKTFSLGDLRAGRFADRGQALFWDRLDDSSNPFPDGTCVVTLLVDGVAQDAKKFTLN